MRQRVLFLVLFVLGFALGRLGTIRAQSNVVFLPFVARAGADTSTVKAENVHYYPERKRFFGEIVNETAYTVGLEGLTVYLLDCDGQPADSETGSPLSGLLTPGERTPFRTSWYDSPPQ